MKLNPLEQKRYTRHLQLSEIGLEGQLKLKGSRILIIGLGGLGSPASLYLTAAGIGTLGIIDSDQVSLSNLQRQILYSTHQVQQSKVNSAQDRLSGLNPEISIQAFPYDLTPENAEEIIQDYDVVIDGSDNFETRYLVSDVCTLLRKPLVYGAIMGFEGHLSFFHPPHGPCYRCLYPTPPSGSAVPSCDINGVLGVLPGTIGVLQATEALKWILGIGKPLVGRLLTYDALEMRFDTFQLKAQATCPSCGPNSEPDFLKTQITQKSENRFTEFSSLEWQIVDVRDPEEYETHHLPSALNIPLSIIQDQMSVIDRDKKLLIYCQSGVRSAKAIDLLRAKGIEADQIPGGLNAFLRSRNSYVRKQSSNVSSPSQLISRQGNL